MTRQRAIDAARQAAIRASEYRYVLRCGEGKRAEFWPVARWRWNYVTMLDCVIEPTGNQSQPRQVRSA